jgi:two-component system LytT family sensor kinase
VDNFSLDTGFVNFIALILLIGIILVVLIFNSYAYLSSKDKILGWYNVYLLASLLFTGWNFYKLVSIASTRVINTANSADQLFTAIAGLAYIYFFGKVFALSGAKKVFRFCWLALIFTMYVQIAILIAAIISGNINYFNTIIWSAILLIITITGLVILFYAIFLNPKTLFQKIILTGSAIFYVLVLLGNLQEYDSRRGLPTGVNMLIIALITEHIFFAIAAASRIKNIFDEATRLKISNYKQQLETEQVTSFFTSTIHQHDNTGDMLWDVTRNLIGKLGFEDCMIYLWNENKTILMQKAGYGIKGSMQVKQDKMIYNIPRGKGKAMLVNDTTKDNRYFAADDKIRLSELCVPIIYNNAVTGAINTEHSEKNFYTERHVQVLTTIASLLAEKIQKIEAQQLTREKELEVLKLYKDLAESQLMALRAQMNPHFIFNAMNSIQQFTLKGDIDNANLYISKFSTLLRKVLHSSQQNYITLEEEMEQLNLYLDIEKLRLGNEFSYSVKAGEEIETDALKIPGMLVQPFVENALKHGLAPKEGPKKLTVDFSLLADDKLQVVITDNGIGRKKAQELKLQQEKMLPYESKGIRLVEERLKLLGGKRAENIIRFEDLYDKEGRATGTSLTLLIRLHTV